MKKRGNEFEREPGGMHGWVWKREKEWKRVSIKLPSQNYLKYNKRMLIDKGHKE